MSFQLEHTIEDSQVVIKVSGYLERFGGEELKRLIDNQLDAGSRKFIFDFSGLQLINSQGLAFLLESAGKAVEEFDGAMATFGCDKQTQAVLEMSSFFYLAPEAKDLEEAKSRF